MEPLAEEMAHPEIQILLGKYDSFPASQAMALTRIEHQFHCLPGI